MEMPKVSCKKVILSCHETEVYNIRKKNTSFDTIHYVSQFQKDWQALNGTVIPNVISPLRPKLKSDFRVAGILGSIDRNKRVVESISRALEDNITDIRLYGNVSDMEYFMHEVVPLLGGNVCYRGVYTNPQQVYDSLTHVYHSPKLETYNMIKPECQAAGVTYMGLEGNDTQAEVWNDDRIFEAWKTLLLS